MKWMRLTITDIYSSLILLFPLYVLDFMPIICRNTALVRKDQAIKR